MFLAGSNGEVVRFDVAISVGVGGAGKLFECQP